MNMFETPSHRRRLVGVLAASALFLGACSSSDGGGGELTANAGDDTTVVAGEAPLFDGCDSTGDIVNFQWQIVGTPEANADDEGKFLRIESSDCSFTLENVMEVDEVGLWTIELSIEGEDGTVLTDTVDVDVTDS